MREQTVAAIAVLIGTVEPSVPVERILTAVDAVVTKQPPALRLLVQLEQDPALMTSASPMMPRPLEQIIDRLVSDGASNLRRPRCPSCGHERPLVESSGAGRICNPCGRTHRRVDAACSRCQRMATRHANVAGKDYCSPCWRRERPHADDRLVSDVKTRFPAVDAVAVVAAIPGGADRRLRLALELEAAGEALFHAPASGSVQFAGFYEQLRATGAALGPRGCGHCGRETTATSRLDGLLCCRKCYRAGHLEHCGGCGRLQSLERRQPDGTRLCQRCTNKLPDESADCVTCGNRRLIAVRTPVGPVCNYCYAKNPGSFRDCGRCGRHEHLRASGLCDRCAADDKIHTLFPADIDMNAAATAMRDACLAAESAAILGIFRRKTSVVLLHRLLTASDEISHEMLDAAGTDTATRTVRSLLIEHGLLPERDEHLAQLERWIDQTAATIPDLGERRAFIRFARWRHLRHLRQRSAAISYGQAASRRRELAIVLELLTWTRQRGRILATLTQADVDRWRSAGSREKHRVKAFLDWTRRNGHTTRIDIHQDFSHVLTVTGVDEDARHRLLASVISTDAAAPGGRLAAALVLLYGVRVSRLTQLRLDDIERRDGVMMIRLGREPLALPDELGDIMTATMEARTAARMFGSVGDYDWLFPGTRPGQPLSADALTDRIHKLGVSPRHARAASLASLAQQLPSPVLARLTGLHPSTAVSWAEAVSASHSAYASLRLPALSPPSSR